MSLAPSTFPLARRRAAALSHMILCLCAAVATASAQDGPDFTPRTAFPGIAYNGLIPPNPVIAAGSEFLVALTNGEMRVLSKTGEVVAATTLEAFFAPIVGAGDFITDPRALFDDGRFYVAATSRRSQPFASHFLLAVSAADDPTGSWHHYAFDASRDNQTATDNFADLPSLGIDSNAVYLTANMFHRTTLAFAGAKIRVIPKAPLRAGTPATFHDFAGLSVAGRPVAHIQAAHSLGPTAAGYMLSHRFPNECKLDVWRVVNPTGSNPLLSRTEINLFGTCNLPPSAIQPGGVRRIETGGARLINAVWHDNSLWAATAVGQNLGSGTVAAIRLFQVRTQGFPAVQLLQNTTIGNPTADSYYPAVGLDLRGNAVVVFNRSSASAPVGVHVAYQAASAARTDPIPTQLVKAGETTYVLLDSANRNRWGDYNSVAWDPSDNSLWLAAEFAASPMNTWGTWIAAYGFAGAIFTPTATASPTATHSATATATNSATATATPSVTNTATVTSTPTESATPEPTATPSATASASLTPTTTATPSPAATSTNTASPTMTTSRTPTQTPFPTRTPTRTLPPTPTFTPTITRTSTPTHTATITATSTASVTPTITATPTLTQTPTTTPTPGPSDCCQCALPACGPVDGDGCGPGCFPVFDASCDVTSGICAAHTPTPTYTATASATDTATASPTATTTETATATASPTHTATETPSATASVTASVTPTETATDTPTPSAPPSATASMSATPTATATATSTMSATVTPTVTHSPTESPTTSPTATATVTPTSTPTSTPTPTPTVSSTPTPTPHPADLDHNGIIDAADLAILLRALFSANGAAADVNGDAATTSADIVALLNSVDETLQTPQRRP